MKPSKSLASISLDLDNKWSYMKTHGDKGWGAFPSYLDTLVPRVLDFLHARRLSITFFVVGQDAALPQNRDALRALGANGTHEIGNHSFHHEPWLHLYTRTEIEIELARAEEAIEAATNVRPRGFRGPGFSFSPTVLDVLVRRGYEYDASTFPTFLGPLARAYYFASTRLTPQERDERKQLFGRFAEGFRPLKPYHWQTGAGKLVEIPVTTMPFVKLPIHASYLLYLSSFHKHAAKLALTYFDAALRLCAATNTEPSLLLHPLDFLGREDVEETRELAFFPAMSVARASKIELLDEALNMMSERFEALTMGEHARRTVAHRALPIVHIESASPHDEHAAAMVKKPSETRTQ